MTDDGWCRDRVRMNRRACVCMTRAPAVSATHSGSSLHRHSVIRDQPLRVVLCTACVPQGVEIKMKDAQAVLPSIGWSDLFQEQYSMTADACASERHVTKSGTSCG